VKAQNEGMVNTETGTAKSYLRMSAEVLERLIA
jgi:hypothetical protein